jgi:hypothetical protein
MSPPHSSIKAGLGSVETIVSELDQGFMSKAWLCDAWIMASRPNATKEFYAAFECAREASIAAIQAKVRSIRRFGTIAKRLRSVAPDDSVVQHHLAANRRGHFRPLLSIHVATASQGLARTPGRCIKSAARCV